MRTRTHTQGVSDLITPLERLAIYERGREPENSNILRAANLQLILAMIEEEMNWTKEEKTRSFLR